MSVEESFPLDELNFMQYGFKMSPSTLKTTWDCNLYLYHHKIIRSPVNPHPSMPLYLGSFGHRDFDVYFDLVDMKSLFSFESWRDIARLMLKPMPSNMKPSFIQRIAPHIVGFSKYEFERFQRLKDFVGEKTEIWNYYMPIMREFEYDNLDIGITFRVDVMYTVPPNYYGNHGVCVEIADYKTGKVPPCSHGIKTDKKTGKTVKVPIEMGDDVELQIMFEALFLKHFGIPGIPDLLPRFGKVLYTIDGTTVTEEVTYKRLSSVFEKLKKAQNMIQTGKYYFNSWHCNKLSCEYDKVCIRSPTISPAERAMLMRLYSQKPDGRDRASDVLFSKVNEIHDRIVQQQQECQEQTEGQMIDDLEVEY